MKALSKILFAVVASGLVAGAYAAETDIEVTASVNSTCSILSAENLNFGQLNPAAASNQSVTGNVSLACTRDTNWTLTAGNGAHFDATNSKRRMNSGADYLPYDLSQSTGSGTGAGFSTPQSVTMTASVLGADYQNLPAVAFSDTVTLTLLP